MLACLILDLDFTVEMVCCDQAGAATGTNPYKQAEKLSSVASF
ncbi:hypothetical protein [Paenibacillus macerans]|nr:hypothetical protein [Paenibacillus macerans]